MAGSDEEREAFVHRALRRRAQEDDVNKKVRRTRNWLFAVGAISFLPYAITGEAAMIISGLIVAMLFCGLAFWTRTEPYPALLTALVLFVALNLLAAADDPINLTQGIILKVILIGGMISSMKGLLELQRK